MINHLSSFTRVLPKKKALLINQKCFGIEHFVLNIASDLSDRLRRMELAPFLRLRQSRLLRCHRANPSTFLDK
jgi:hypothetical protein